MDGPVRVLYVDGDREAAAERRRLRRLLAGTDVAVATLDPDGTVRSYEPAAGEPLGYGADDPTGEALFDRVHPDDRGAAREAVETAFHDQYRRAMAQQESIAFEEYYEAIEELARISSTAGLSFEEKLDRLLEPGCSYLNLPYGFLTEIDADANRVAGADADTNGTGTETTGTQTVVAVAEQAVVGPREHVRCRVADDPGDRR